MDLKALIWEVMSWVRLDQYSDGGACECHSEPLVPILCGKYLDQHGNCNLFKKGAVPWS